MPKQSNAGVNAAKSALGQWDGALVRWRTREDSGWPSLMVRVEQEDGYAGLVILSLMLVRTTTSCCCGSCIEKLSIVSHRGILTGPSHISWIASWEPVDIVGDGPF